MSDETVETLTTGLRIPFERNNESSKERSNV